MIMEYLHLMLKPFVELSPLLTRNEVKLLFVSSPYSHRMHTHHVNTEAQFEIKSAGSKIHPVHLLLPDSRANVYIRYILGNYFILITVFFEKIRA